MLPFTVRFRTLSSSLGIIRIRRSWLHGMPPHSGRRYAARRWGIVGATTVMCGGVLVALQPKGGVPEAREKPPFSGLLRSYLVYSLISIPSLVDHAPAILSALTSVAGVKQITESFVRATFFSQFVGGETVEETIPLVHRFRRENKGALLVYSVEVDHSKASEHGHAASSDAQQQSRMVDEILHCIDVAADYEDRVGRGPVGDRKTWLAVKMTALLPDANALARLSSHLLTTRSETARAVPFPGTPESTDLAVLEADPSCTQMRCPLPTPLSQDDIVILRGLYVHLVRICTRAQERGIRVLIDAEYSWYQPAIDAMTLSLMQRFNAIPPRTRGSSALSNPQSDVMQPLVYGTFQAYLRRTQSQLAVALDHAAKHNYALGVKLVRGAYHPYELAAHAGRYGKQTQGEHTESFSLSKDTLPPVWTAKEDTDACFDTCAQLLLEHVRADISDNRGSGVPGLAVVFGTHNWASCRRILDVLVKFGLATRVGQDGPEGKVGLGAAVTERVAVAQLYGIADALTDYLANRTRSQAPFVVKYIPYGTLSEVMPYLSRRAIENKSVLGAGGAVEERRRVSAEIWRRARSFGRLHDS